MQLLELSFYESSIKHKMMSENVSSEIVIQINTS